MQQSSVRADNSPLEVAGLVFNFTGGDYLTIGREGGRSYQMILLHKGFGDYFIPLEQRETPDIMVQLGTTVQDLNRILIEVARSRQFRSLAVSVE